MWGKSGVYGHSGLKLGSSEGYVHVAEGQSLHVDGKVGIGTTDAKRKLHVESGELRIRASHNSTSADIGEFFAENLTQGIGIGYNRIEAIGSNANQDILLLPKGTGNVGIGNPGGNHFKFTGLATHRKRSTPDF